MPANALGTATHAHTHTHTHTQRREKALSKLGASAMHVLLVRHGETEWNRLHILQGQDPKAPGLNASGRRQAAEVRRSKWASGTKRPIPPSCLAARPTLCIRG